MKREGWTGWILITALLIVGCDVGTAPTPTPPITATEQPVTLIPLAGDIAQSQAEVSGLAWYGDHLILLPQYPGRFSSEDDGRLFTLSKADLLAFLEGASEAPLRPREISFIAPGLAQEIQGFEGYEAIAFRGAQVFVTVEAQVGDGMRGHLIAGEIEPDLSALRLDPDSRAEIAPQADLDNMAYEALLLSDETLVTLYEANGQNVNPQPAAKRFDLSLNPLPALSFPTIEYRVTDVTTLDDAGRFWAINYFYPGDLKLRPAADSLVAAYGQGPTHARFETVERLVAFQYTAAGIALVDRPPLQLTLWGDDRARNWEGIVRLEQRGFLLMTDRHPETILGFVPLP